jgi:hypothetical protein
VAKEEEEQQEEQQEGSCPRRVLRPIGVHTLLHSLQSGEQSQSQPQSQSHAGPDRITMSNAAGHCYYLGIPLSTTTYTCILGESRLPRHGLA